MKKQRRAVSGVLLLDKPANLSSNSAVGWAKRLFNAAKAGHTGTLDPFATGLLPICLGEATKFSRFMLDAEKGYRATLRLGERSSTGDTEGEILERRPVTVSGQEVIDVLRRFVGNGSQIPPMHSALKRDGVPLYKLARQGIEVERTPRNITVHSLSAVSLNGVDLVIDTLVSKGTYVRVLAQDIGEALGCGAHLTALQRTTTGGFSIDRATTFETLDQLSLGERDANLLPPDALALALPAVHLDSVAAAAVCEGRNPPLKADFADQTEVRIYRESDFLGIARASKLSGGGCKLTAVRLMATGGAIDENN
ncbi:MAG: tRNA pseudouridine(55) synthase TruB [Betaproteobacteria bacterium]|nr:tRNA pseudouridine(55) synthase TruB [Betaproteobacteria bacterium]